MNLEADSSTIRTFVSSTFKDMLEERSHLAAHVFPALRDFCRRRGREWIEIDLRWGIDPGSQRSEIARRCFDAIDDCAPWFIGILGDRYGTIDPEINETYRLRRPPGGVHGDRSITELEFRHGVLDNPDHTRRARIYLREPVSVETDEPTGHRRMLEAFRSELMSMRDRGLRVRTYRSALELGRALLDDLREDIEERIGSSAPASRDDFWEWIRFMSRRALPQPGVMDELDDYMRHGGPPIAIVGPPGIGKTWTLARWIHGRDEAGFGRPSAYFATAPGGRPELLDALEPAVTELRRILGRPSEPIRDVARARSDFHTLLTQAGHDTPFLFVLDGLDRLRSAGEPVDLSWVPDIAGSLARLVFSSAEPSDRDVFLRAGFRIVPHPELAPESRVELARRRLEPSHKSLGSTRAHRIFEAPSAANPLFLSAIVDGIRTAGGPREADERLDAWLRLGDAPQLYKDLLGRWETVYGQDLVEPCLSWLTISPTGLRDVEVRALLESRGMEDALARYTVFRIAAGGALIEVNGATLVGHDVVRRAIEERYQFNGALRTRLHSELADHFGSESVDPGRRLQLLPVHLFGASRHDDLLQLLSEPLVFLDEFRNRPKMLTEWFQAIRTGMEPAHACRQRLTSWQESAKPGERELVPDILDSLGVFFHERIGDYFAAEEFLRDAIAATEARDGHDSDATIISINNLAALYDTFEQPADSIPLHREVLEHRRARLGESHSKTILAASNLAHALTLTGDWAASEELLVEFLPLAQQVLPMHDPMRWILVNNLALVRQAQGRFPEALALFAEASQGHSAAFGELDPRSLEIAGNLAWSQVELKRFDAGLQTLQRLANQQASISPGESPALLTTWNNIGAALTRVQRYADAETWLRKACEGRSHKLGPGHPKTLQSRSNLGTCLLRLGRLDEAGREIRSALHLRKRSLPKGHPDITDGASSLGLWLYEKMRFVLAARVFRWVLRRRSQTFGPEHPSAVLVAKNLSNALRGAGRLDEAKSILADVIRHRSKADGAHAESTLSAEADLVTLHEETGQHELALALAGDLTARAEAHHGRLARFTGLLRSQYALRLHRAGRNSEAVAHQAWVVEAFSKCFGDDASFTREARRRLTQFGP